MKSVEIIVASEMFRMRKMKAETASLKGRSINDTSVRPPALLRKARRHSKEEKNGKKKEIECNAGRSGNMMEPRMEFTVRVGSILRGLLPRCWVAESGSQSLGGFISMSTSGSYSGTISYRAPYCLS